MSELERVGRAALARLDAELRRDARRDPAAYARRRRIQGATCWAIARELRAARVPPSVARLTVWTSVGVARLLAGEAS